MRIKCIDCNKRFRTQGACNMHAADKHPHAVHARMMASSKPVRKHRSNVFITAVAGAFVGCLAFAGLLVFTVGQSRAVEITPHGVTLKPWITTVNQAARR